MLSSTQIEEYLKRIKCTVPMIKADHNTLKSMHKSHLYNIPFENLDVFLKRSINLNKDMLFAKVISGKRGGFCYELNNLFYMLLSSLGFKVSFLAAQIYKGDTFGKPFAHVLLLVEFESVRVIADVGFGRAFLEPIMLTEDISHQVDADYRVLNDAGKFVLSKKTHQDAWSPLYSFSLKSYQLSDFYEMCDYQQYSSNSIFTQTSLCSILTSEGRKTLSNNRFIESNPARLKESTGAGTKKCKQKLKVEKKREQIIQSEYEYNTLLLKYFGFSLPGHLIAEKILAIK